MKKKCIYPNCLKCSLNLIDVKPNCIYDLLEEKARLTKRLNNINEILEKYKDKEVEVEE